MNHNLTVKLFRYGANTFFTVIVSPQNLVEWSLSYSHFEYEN